MKPVAEEGNVSLGNNGHGTVINGRYLLTHRHHPQPLLTLVADESSSELATIKLYRPDGTFLWL